MAAKRFLQMIGVVFLVSIVGSVFWFFNTSVEKQLNNYTKEKYGEKVILVEQGATHTGNMGDTVHKVALKSNPSVAFNIEVDGDLFGRTFTVVRDDLEYARKASKELIKLDPYLDKIASLGFSLSDLPTFDLYSEIRSTEPYQVNLIDKKGFSLSNFESETITRYYSLVELLKKADTKFVELEIQINLDSQPSIYLKDIPQIASKSILKRKMITNNHTILDHLLNEEMKELFTELEKDRFIFKGNSFIPELGVGCDEVSVNGECDELTFYVEYVPTVTSDNPVIAEDALFIRDALIKEIPEDTRFNLAGRGVPFNGYYLEDLRSLSDEEIKNQVQQALSE
ncbi:hypothetical protein [Mangrovibacillus cuniculi]|uniref:Uncharacterized protein n=1 Tax=Mangrovibacillus cuniculi TaxID=2593652 RepID=A0A7S8CCR6_9BACI|nr:hypothetical protein [Mangrovibacillus cuniculi]QPC47596.1 hypothetical protein G8O30_11850 [Mangrovibacillus cuniculi]